MIPNDFSRLSSSQPTFVARYSTVRLLGLHIHDLGAEMSLICITSARVLESTETFTRASSRSTDSPSRKSCTFDNVHQLLSA